MKRYLAPLEGNTGYIYRNAWMDLFGGADRLFTPFVSPNQTLSFLSKEWNDIIPEHNQGFEVIPQILSNRAEYFLWAAGEMEKLGYQEVNLNLGCPSGTVVSKRRGSGFLAYPEDLDAFLDAIYSGTSLKISIKTRLGRDSAEEFPRLLEIFNQYPVTELIVHARVQKDMYKNTPNWDAFAYALEHSKSPVCYNGDVYAAEDEERLKKAFPELNRVMMGRGAIANPALMRELSGGPALQPGERAGFHERLLQDYRSVLSGDGPVLYKMKELWYYWSWCYEDPERTLKKVRKCKNGKEYEAVAGELLEKDPCKGVPSVLGK